MGVKLLDATWKRAPCLTLEKTALWCWALVSSACFQCRSPGKHSSLVIAGRARTRPCVRHVALNAFLHLCMGETIPTEKEASKHLNQSTHVQHPSEAASMVIAPFDRCRSQNTDKTKGPLPCPMAGSRIRAHMIFRVGGWRSRGSESTQHSMGDLTGEEARPEQNYCHTHAIIAATFLSPDSGLACVVSAQTRYYLL